ncbi:uncharacterized protein LOC127277610 [Leptopilina boulardi]|uniref:uncharacterized protein LOC127277610 n=1 Tax=Leptopilina boulardi TaxID=63433 RepID=UPI0021F548B1|nr:uncharacterized protein LOC127277610 [Leptopilina boulardi]
MPATCLVLDCKSRNGVDSVNFFRIPVARKLKSEDLCKLVHDRREKWLRVLKRGELTKTQLENGRICSKHFITGKPAAFYESHHPDWVPNQHMGYSVGVMLKKPSDVERYERTKRRAYQKLSILIEKSIPHVEGADSSTEVSFPNLVIETNEIVSLPKENEAVSECFTYKRRKN